MQTLFGFSGTLKRYSYWVWSSVIHVITLAIIAISVTSQGGLAAMLQGGGTPKSTAMIMVPIAANVYIQSALMVKRNRDAAGATWLCHLFIGSLIFAGLQQGMQLSAGELGINIASLISGVLWTKLGMVKSASLTDATAAKAEDPNPGRHPVDNAPPLTTDLLDPDMDLVARARELREQEPAKAEAPSGASSGAARPAARASFGKRTA